MRIIYLFYFVINVGNTVVGSDLLKLPDEPKPIKHEIRPVRSVSCVALSDYEGFCVPIRCEQIYQRYELFRLGYEQICS